MESEKVSKIWRGYAMKSFECEKKQLKHNALKDTF